MNTRVDRGRCGAGPLAIPLTRKYAAPSATRSSTVRSVRLGALTSATIFAATAASHAALAPNYQRARELSAVIDAVAALVEGYPIDEVAYRGDYLYEVTAGPCTVQARIVTIPTPEIAGPLKFRVELGEPACTE